MNYRNEADRKANRQPVNEGYAKNAQLADQRIAEFYTPELLALVREIYTIDFAEFGFDPYKYDALFSR